MSEIFEISDFTTSSEFERFVSELEECLLRQKKTSGIRFGRSRFTLNFFDFPNTENDFEDAFHPLVTCFGVSKLAILEEEDNRIASEDRMRLILSSLALALSQLKIALPVFTRTGSLFFGHSVSDLSRVLYSSLEFKTFQKNFKYLNTFSRIFKQKLSNSQPIRVSIRMTYLRQVPPLSLRLVSLWNSLSEEVFIDSDIHSDLEPMRAHAWKVRVEFRNEPEVKGLEHVFRKFLRFSQSNLEMTGSEEPETDIRMIMNRLADEKVKRSPRDSIRHVFESAQMEGAWSGLKSSPIGSILWLLSQEILFNCETEAEVKAIWTEMTSYLRKCWEQSRKLNIESTSGPDFRFCVFHQKLQLFNKCLEQKEPEVDSQEPEEEFFDCEEEMDEKEPEVREMKPEGRLKRTEMRLTGSEDEFLWVPVTQDPPPLTEDQLEERERVLSQIQEARDQHVLRARVQSACLLSDMEAFKAANPLSKFEDFVRWHSPRDFHVAENELSARFKAKDNLWFDCWKSARALSVKKQKKLFDVTLEAEKVLHEVGGVSLRGACALMKPICLDLLREHVLLERERAGLSEEDWPMRREVFEFESEEHVVLEYLKGFDLFLNRFKSLLNLFEDNEEEEEETRDREETISLVRKLLKEPEIELNPFDKNARLLKHVFSDQENTWCEWTRKEFVLKTRARVPELWSRDLDQRMYACVDLKEGTRVCSSFAEDIHYT